MVESKSLRKRYMEKSNIGYRQTNDWVNTGIDDTYTNYDIT